MDIDMLKDKKFWIAFLLILAANFAMYLIFGDHASLIFDMGFIYSFIVQLIIEYL
jgi:hypothetical protein